MQEGPAEAIEMSEPAGVFPNQDQVTIDIIQNISHLEKPSWLNSQ